MSNPRNRVLNFRASDDESEWIEKKFALSESRNKSEFLRKIILYGYVVKCDMSEVQNLFKLMNNISNNLNQIYHKAKAINSPFLMELEMMKSEVEEVWQLLKFMQSTLQKLKP